MPTSADRRAAATGLAALLVLVLDVHTMQQLQVSRDHCGGGLEPTRSRLLTVIEAPPLHDGLDATGTAVVSNSSGGRVVVRRADAVLLEPGSHRVATWTGAAGFTPTVLPPNTFAQVSFTLHVTRCRSGGQLQPGFYDLALLLVEEDATGVHRTVSPPRTVVLPP